MGIQQHRDALQRRTSALLAATVKAGTNITANRKQWTHAQGSVMIWLYDGGSDFGSCAGDKEGWFKVNQMGPWGSNLNSENWGTAIVLKRLKWSSKIPSNVKTGNYLVRHEPLAPHQANTPQFYAECAQLVVEGGGTAQPPLSFLKNIPGYASRKDPGIIVCSFG
ncbi:glycoside hydrolase family 61 protein [Colletotrichum tofieldiae]|nr:glycoside hydrolase family 61 protein [Colletotrichum tofieldiae]GKT69767.1 glycoside hydrolase family 61 protein [Colletotrichum tofieldiae]GKT92780.1 glycoside hydrolase family 61 protein [Colletotrichum tofieldiae]